jgi:hypothetical protein
MVDQLDNQLSLLEDYTHRAFGEGRKEFLPEVATKLRVLVVRSRKNVPLLFEVARRLDVEPKVILEGPPIKPEPGEPSPGDEIALDDFFNLQAVTVRTSAGLVTMTKRELIRAWCEQLGGAHEDWAVDEALVNAIHAPISVGGMQPTAMELRNLARTTLRYGRHLVEFGRRATKR